MPLLGIFQVFYNFFSNAVKYSPPETTVTIRAFPENGHSVFEVEDQGPGIAPEDLPHLFERFYRGSSPRGRSGTGIGLALAKAIVERHGGVISATAGTRGSRGTGARFTITLPRAGRANLTNL